MEWCGPCGVLATGSSGSSADAIATSASCTEPCSESARRASGSARFKVDKQESQAAAGE